MPDVQLQLSQYLSTTRKLTEEARKYKEEALNIQEKNKILIHKKARLLEDRLRITIGFCKSVGGRLKRPFVAWYDHGLKLRFVLCIDALSHLMLIPWKDWKQSFQVIAQFDAPEHNLLPGMITLRECLSRTKSHRLSIIKMLQAIGLAGNLHEKSKINELYGHLVTHPAFHPADPRNYLEDITDEE